MILCVCFPFLIIKTQTKTLILPRLAKGELSVLNWSCDEHWGLGGRQRFSPSLMRPPEQHFFSVGPTLHAACRDLTKLKRKQSFSSNKSFIIWCHPHQLCNFLSLPPHSSTLALPYTYINFPQHSFFWIKMQTILLHLVRPVRNILIVW